MKIYHSILSVDSNLFEKGCALTTGTFDGVHLGHQKILSMLCSVAEKDHIPSVVVTFNPHPRKIISQDASLLKILTTLDEKIDILSKLGVNHLIIHPFDGAFSKIPFTLFVRDYLINHLRMKKMIVGYDHHLGKNREGGYENLKELEAVYEFNIHKVDAYVLNGVHISSSKIRQALLAGDVKLASSYLKRNYCLTAKVVEGDKIGRTLGFPTANLVNIDPDKLIPADGIYAVYIYINAVKYSGMMSIGPRPTFAKTERTMEVNIFDFSEDIYQQTVVVEWVDKIRNVERFSSSEMLIDAMKQDKEKTLQILL